MFRRKITGKREKREKAWRENALAHSSALKI